MVVQLVFLQLILLLWPSAVEPYLAKHGCDDRCGNVTIPYPFGMGNNNCFIDQWFEIDCKRTDNSSSSPFLKKLDLEVLQISLPPPGLENPGLIRVNTPVLSNCNPSPRTALNFRGSPFVFSQTENSFTAAGCDNRALMADIEPVLSGCASFCGGSCCQATIPSNLQVFNVTFEGKAEECKYAFLVSKKWSRPDSSCFAAVQHLEYVPTLLEWGIFNWSAKALGLKGTNYWPTSYSYCQNGTGLPGIIQCFCDYGFNGSGYLPGSCEDINECLEDPNICLKRGGGTCVNLIGGYRCDHRKSRVNIGAIIGNCKSRQC